MSVLDDIIVTGGRPNDGLYSVPINVNTVIVTVNPEFSSEGSAYLPDYMQMGSSNQAAEIVGKGAKALAAVIKAITDTLRGVLIPREAARLDALHTALTLAGDGLIAGTLDWGSARPIIKSAFTIALDQAGGKVFSVIFGAAGSFAAANAPLPPQAKAVVVGLSGLTGYIVGEAANDAWVEPIAGYLTDGVFYGAEALGWLMYNMTEAVKMGADPATWTIGSFPPRPNLGAELSTDQQMFYLTGAI